MHCPSRHHLIIDLVSIPMTCVLIKMALAEVGCLDTTVESFELFEYDAHQSFGGSHKQIRLKAFRHNWVAIL